MSKLQDDLYKKGCFLFKKHELAINSLMKYIVIFFLFVLSAVIQYLFMFSGTIFFGDWGDVISIPLYFLGYLILNMILITKNNDHGLVILNIGFILLLIYLYWIENISPLLLLSVATM